MHRYQYKKKELLRVDRLTCNIDYESIDGMKVVYRSIKIYCSDFQKFNLGYTWYLSVPFCFNILFQCFGHILLTDLE